MEEFYTSETFTALSCIAFPQHFGFANSFLMSSICLHCKGKELLNDRVRVEEGALKQQLAPPNYR